MSFLGFCFDFWMIFGPFGFERELVVFALCWPFYGTFLVFFFPRVLRLVLFGSVWSY